MDIRGLRESGFNTEKKETLWYSGCRRTTVHIRIHYGLFGNILSDLSEDYSEGQMPIGNDVGVWFIRNMRYWPSFYRNINNEGIFSVSK